VQIVNIQKFWFKQLVAALVVAPLLIVGGCGGGNGNPSGPSVTRIAPLIATVGAPYTFKVVGTNLPLTALILTEDGVCTAPTNSSDTGFTQTCTFSSAGTKVTTVKTTALGFGFISLHSVVVEEARYAKVCNNGLVAGRGTCPANPPLGSALNEWACTFDTVTRKMWEVKTPPNSATPGLRDSDLRYTNYDDTLKLQITVNGVVIKPTQAQIDAPTNVMALQKLLNGNIATAGQAPLCGSTEWRRPTKTELASLVQGTIAPTIDSAFFPDTQGDNYLTNTREVVGQTTIENTLSVVSFNSGSDCCYNTRDTARFARLVTAPPVGYLTDTGITAAQCYELGSNVLVACNSPGALSLNNSQDGMLGEDVSNNNPVDGRLGFTYALVPKAGGGNNAITDCVKDKASGLIWEGGAIGGLRDVGRTFSNFDDATKAQKYDGSQWIMPTQAEVDAPSNSIGYKNAVNATALCGFTDWRLPVPEELEALLDFGAIFPAPAIDYSWFRDARSGYYWASVPDVQDGWLVSFNNIASQRNSRWGTHHVRLVRGPLPDNTARYKLANNGSEVLDKKTGLTWRRCSEGKSWNGTTCAGTFTQFTHEKALIHAQSQIGWRIPSAKEIASIADRTKFSPAIDLGAFPDTPTGGVTWSDNYYYWSSTPYVSQPELARAFSFVQGSSHFVQRINGNFILRLVKE
jgi:Protein of unknown function (DUF1566)